MQSHYDGVAEHYDRITARSHYYHRALHQSLREVVPPGRRVLDVGAATGEMLASVEPAYGVGIDLSAAMVQRAQAKFPHLKFLSADILEHPLNETFEFVISVNLLEHVTDVRRVMLAMAALVEPGGTLVAITPHPAWALPIFVADHLGRKVPEGWHRWCSRRDLIRAGRAAGLRLTRFDRDFVVPREMWVLSSLNSARWAIPLRERFGVIQRVVFRRPSQGAA